MVYWSYSLNKYATAVTATNIYSIYIVKYDMDLRTWEL